MLEKNEEVKILKNMARVFSEDIKTRFNIQKNGKNKENEKRSLCLDALKTGIQRWKIQLQIDTFDRWER